MLAIWRPFSRQFSGRFAYSEFAQIRFEFSGEYFDGGRLSDAVRADQSEHFSCAWRRQSVQLERVRSVAVRRVLLQVARQVNDRNRLVRTFLK